MCLIQKLGERNTFIIFSMYSDKTDDKYSLGDIKSLLKMFNIRSRNIAIPIKNFSPDTLFELCGNYKTFFTYHLVYW